MRTYTHGMDDKYDGEMFRDEGIGSDEVEEFSDDNDEYAGTITFIE